MKTYEYQILRYLPDRVNAEFVNVGLVFYAREERYLRSNFINKAKRLSSFFYGLDTHHILQTIRHFQDEFNKEANKINNELAWSELTSIQKITSRLLVKDDTALVFSEVYKGIDVSLDSAFESLCNQLIFKYDTSKRERKTLSDSDVWNKIYRHYFKKTGLESKLKEHIVKTEYASITFSKAWKNQNWRCYEPVSFDLKRREDVQNKVLQWSGVIKWLETSLEPIEVQLLSVLPAEKDLRDMTIHALKDQHPGNSTFDLIGEDEVEEFAQQLSLDFAEHETKNE
ncbi:MAG: DUF3037 domain-containing protein [Candidatus Thorarchaeota archaeon]